MKVQRVYIDTSVLGGCFDAEFAPWSNALMSDFRLGRLRPVVSELIEAELADAPEKLQDVYVDLLMMETEVLSLTDSALALADIYQQRGILMPKFYDDGAHIALAIIAEVDLIGELEFQAHRSFR